MVRRTRSGPELVTSASVTLLAHLRQHVGSDTARKKSLRAHVQRATGKPLDRGNLHRYLRGQHEIRLDLVIPILRWMQLEGLIKPCSKKTGLFVYCQRLKTTKNMAKKPFAKAA